MQYSVNCIAQRQRYPYRIRVRNVERGARAPAAGRPDARAQAPNRHTGDRGEPWPVAGGVGSDIKQAR